MKLKMESNINLDSYFNSKQNREKVLLKIKESLKPFEINKNINYPNNKESFRQFRLNDQPEINNKHSNILHESSTICQENFRNKRQTYESLDFLNLCDSKNNNHLLYNRSVNLNDSFKHPRHDIINTYVNQKFEIENNLNDTFIDKGKTTKMVLNNSDSMKDRSCFNKEIIDDVLNYDTKLDLVNNKYLEPSQKKAIKKWSAEAFKFYIEQHIENVHRSFNARNKRKCLLESKMDELKLPEHHKKKLRQELAQRETYYLRLKRTKINIDQFVIIKKIGAGAFGKVFLVRQVENANIYAMKILNKVQILKNNQIAHVKAERDILAEADSEWVVKLFFSFQDDINLYLVIEYVPGGDLMSLLMKYNIFDEKTSCFYISELILAVDFIHKMDFVHRDIKPDNILIDINGHLKLTDFGLSTGFRWTHDSCTFGNNAENNQEEVDNGMNHLMKMAQDMNIDDKTMQYFRKLKPLARRLAIYYMKKRTHSFVGTPNYMAPEIIQPSKSGYSRSCDWWSVGIILYEMLIGCAPFLSPSIEQTILMVVNWKQFLEIPNKISDSATDLIKQLLTDANRRIGSNGAAEIKSHDFFKHVDWSVNIRKLQAPYKPTITHDFDTSNFDIDIESSNAELQSIFQATNTSSDTSVNQHAFLEFTYRRFGIANKHLINQ